MEKIELPWSESGFQIGGYYSPAHFEVDPEATGCIELVLHSDGEFPTDNPNEMLRLHLCEFEQLEMFVENWGKELRRRGIIE